MAERLLILSALVLVIGMLGVLWRRGLLVSLLSLQLMFGAGALAFVTLGSAQPAAGAAPATSSQSFAVVILVLALVQFVVGLAVGLAVVRERKTTDVGDVGDMRG